MLKFYLVRRPLSLECFEWNEMSILVLFLVLISVMLPAFWQVINV